MEPRESPMVSRPVQLISPARFDRYLRATSGHTIRARRLYDWNIEAAGAVFEVLQRFEVVLRNAIDEQLRSWNSDQGLSADWTDDPADLLNRLMKDGEDLEKARRRAEQHVRSSDRQTTHDDMVAQLDFSTWRYLMPRRGDAGSQLLWSEALQHAFPERDGDTDGDVTSRRVATVWKLRNRVAHHEPVALREDALREQMSQLFAVARSIDARTGDWITATSRVSEVLKRRPS